MFSKESTYIRIGLFGIPNVFPYRMQDIRSVVYLRSEVRYRDDGLSQSGDDDQSETIIKRPCSESTLLSHISQERD